MGGSRPFDIHAIVATVQQDFWATHAVVVKIQDVQIKSVKEKTTWIAIAHH